MIDLHNFWLLISLTFQIVCVFPIIYLIVFIIISNTSKLILKVLTVVNLAFRIGWTFSWIPSGSNWSLIASAAILIIVLLVNIVSIISERKPNFWLLGLGYLFEIVVFFYMLGISVTTESALVIVYVGISGLFLLFAIISVALCKYFDRMHCSLDEVHHFTSYSQYFHI